MRDLQLIIKQDEEDPEGAHVLVDGKIGDRPYRFLLDTGAARTSVVRDDYTDTFDAIGNHDSSGVFAAVNDDLIVAPSIEVGPITKEHFTIARKADRKPTLGNLIGMDLLKEFCCHFFFDDNRVTINVPVDAPAGMLFDANVEYDFHELLLDKKAHPYIIVQFGNVAASAVWDTGASMTIADMNFIENHPAFFQAAGISTGTDATGLRMETPMFLMESPHIGGHPFPPLKVAGVDLSSVNARIERPFNLILGYNTMKRANWVFDFPGERWAISKLLTVDRYR